MSCRLLALLHLNRLQRKVLLVVGVIILVPMLVAGVFSASWIARRMDASIERWIHETAQVNSNWLATLNKNGRLFADLYSHIAGDQPRFEQGKSPIPAQLQPLARELGINLVQVFDPDGKQIFSSPQLSLGTSWKPGQNETVLLATQGDKSLLAAVTILRYPKNQPRHYRLVFGTLFDKTILARLGSMSGLKTRLFYPRDGSFSKAFSEEGRPLKLRLPTKAYEELKQQHAYYSDQAEDGKYWGLYTPVSDSSGNVEAVLFSGLARHGGFSFLTDEAAVSILVALLGLLLAGVTGFLLSRIVVRPVTYLREGMMKVAAQDFRASVPIYWRDEVGDLARTFNSMAARLREARDEQRHEFQRDKLTALGELSLAMAHEIRNPIGVIKTATKLHEKTTDPVKRAELDRMTREECERLDQLLKNFQQLAKHRQPEFTRVDPKVPLEKALTVMLTGRDGITVHRDYAHHGQLISADVELIYQAWINLIRNALEAMEGKGELSVGSSLQDNQVVMYLQDSGPGIPLDLMTRLFEPFFSTKSGGSGLGLTLANTLVEACDASLELVHTSEPGARFALRFDISEEQ